MDDMPPDDFSSERTTNGFQNLYTWILIIAGAVTLGINIGGVLIVLSQLSASQVENQNNFKAQEVAIASIKDVTLTQSFLIQSVQKDVGILTGQLASNTAEDNRQWDTIRDNQSKVNQAISREQFIEWKAQLEKKNSNLTSPSL